MNPTNFRFTRERPPNTPEEIARYPSCPSFLLKTMIDIDRQVVCPILNKMRRLEHHLGYLNGRAGYCFRVIWTITYKGKRIELLHNAKGEVQAYIIKKSRKVIPFTEQEKRKFQNNPQWSHFTE